MLHPIELTNKWADCELTTNDIIPKVLDYSNQRTIPITEEEAVKIARQIFRTYLRYHDPEVWAGNFLDAFAGDSIRGVMSAADNLNCRALNIYHYYFYNCVPSD